MRRLAPVFVLLLLSPMVAELLLGSTPLLAFFTPFSLLLEVGLYGAGAVLIRELAQRRGLGWSRILLLGAAYGIIEEGLQIQSFFNVNHPDLGNLAIYGRALGVNWVWAEELIGYHAIWSMTIPILLTELLFPARRGLPWLRTRGLRVIAIIFGLDIVLGGALFTLIFHSKFGYVPPLVPYLGAVALVCLLTWLALRRPAQPAAMNGAPFAVPPARRAPRPWLLRLFSFGAAFAWFFIFLGLTGPTSTIPAPVTMLLGALLALGVWLLVRRWSGPARLWNDRHRLALTAGPLLLLAFLSFILGLQGQTDGKDFRGQFLVGLVAIALLIVFTWRVNRRVKRAAVRPTRSTPEVVPAWHPGAAPFREFYDRPQQSELVSWSGPTTTSGNDWEGN